MLIRYKPWWLVFSLLVQFIDATFGQSWVDFSNCHILPTTVIPLQFVSRSLEIWLYHFPSLSLSHLGWTAASLLSRIQLYGLCLLSASFFFVLLVRLYAAVTLSVASPRGTHSPFFRALSLLFSLPSSLDQSLRKFRGRSFSRKLFLIPTATPAPFPGSFPST